MGEPAGKLGQQSHFMKGVFHLSLSVILIFVKVVIDQTLRDNIVHLGPFIQRGQRVLENHLTLFDYLFVQFTGNLPADPLPFKEDLTAGDGVDPHDGPTDGGFAGAGLAHQREGLPLINIEIDVIYRNKASPAASEGNLQIFDFNQLFSICHHILPPVAHIFPQLLNRVGLLNFRSPGVQIPGLRLMGGTYLKERRLLFEINGKRLRIPRCKRIALNLIEQVRRRTLNGGKILALNPQLRQ